MRQSLQREEERSPHPRHEREKKHFAGETIFLQGTRMRFEAVSCR